jgi:hypothetical protein
MNSHLQRLYRLPSNIFAMTQRLDLGLLHLFQCTHASEMRICRVSGPELTRTNGGPAAFRVVPRAGVAACAGGEDGGLAGYESGWGHVEDELEASGSRSNSCHFESHFIGLQLFNHQGQILMDDNDLETSGPPNLD